MNISNIIFAEPSDIPLLIDSSNEFHLFPELQGPMNLLLGEIQVITEPEKGCVKLPRKAWSDRLQTLGSFIW